MYWLPSVYMNVSNFYEYLGHPKSKFQNALKNARVEIGVYLLYTKFSIFQCRFDTKFFRIFGPVFTVKFKIYHLNSTNLFTGLGFSTYPFLWYWATEIFARWLIGKLRVCRFFWCIVSLMRWPPYLMNAIFPEFLRYSDRRWAT